MSVSPNDRAVQLAARLLTLGLTRRAVVDLLMFPLDVVEQQLDWLPYRKAKRPGAFLIGAVHNNYSPPKETYYAHRKAVQDRRTDPVDQDPEHRDRQADADPPGHGVPGAGDPDSEHYGLE